MNHQIALYGSTVSVTNELVATTAAGKMHMQDLAGSISNVLPVAASAHIAFSQVGGALATMTMQGMSTRRATMNLANMIRALLNPTAAAGTEMKNLGLNANEVSSHLGSAGLTGTLSQLTDAILKNQQGGMVLSSTFNQMSGPAKAIAEQISAGTISTSGPPAGRARRPRIAALQRGPERDRWLPPRHRGHGRPAH